jgi:hypothetical protein
MYKCNGILKRSVVHNSDRIAYSEILVQVGNIADSLN